MYSGAPLDIIKIYSSFSYFISQHIAAYSSAIKFTRLMIPENICVQADGILKPMKTLVLIQHHVERILQKKSKIVIPNCLPLVVGENYTEIKA